jgi:hypothetical protein
MYIFTVICWDSSDLFAIKNGININTIIVRKAKKNLKNQIQNISNFI